MKEVSVAISPCPNDTFIFGALMKDLVDTGDLKFSFSLMDIDALNKAVHTDDFDVLKVSCGVLPSLREPTVILESGAALGMGCGPLLISRTADASPAEDALVLIPGEQTTAFGLLQRYYPHLRVTKRVLFSSIEDHLLQGNADYGLIIHENRFTYAAKGLYCVADLGRLWEEETGLPIPLGCIVAKQHLSNPEMRQIDACIRESLLYARANRQAVDDVIRMHAAEIDPEVQQKHIELYVTDYSIALGEQGRRAITDFVERSAKDPKRHLIRFIS